MPTLTNLVNSGAELGYGSPFKYSYDGPVAAGDFLLVALSHLPVSGVGDQILSGALVFDNALPAGFNANQFGILGVSVHHPSLTFTSMGIYTNWANDGDSMYLHADLYHGASIYASNDTISFAFKHAAGVGNALGVLRRFVPNTTDITAIKSAVIRTFPPS